MDGKRFLVLSLLCVFVAGASGCGSPVSSGKKASGTAFVPGGNNGNNGITDPGVDPDPDDPTPSEAAGFFLKVTSDTANITLHRAGLGGVHEGYPGSPDTSNFTTECRILSTATGSDRDILCIAEMEELDAFFSEISVQYHVPPSMCSYLRFVPYHYYSFEPGVGPGIVVTDFDEATGTYDMLVAQNSNAAGEAVCPYDWRNTAFGPNCCTGTYTRSATVRPITGDPSTTTTANNPWGGSASSCLTGPAMASGDIIKSDAGYPLPLYQFIEGAGYNRKFKVEAGATKRVANLPYESGTFAANFYRACEYTGGCTTPNMPTPPPHPNNGLLTPADRPLAMRTPANVGFRDRHVPSDTYNFGCLDRAEDLNARIRLMVREWNVGPITENCDGTAAKPCPDDTGSDPFDPTEPLNDRRDWYDLDVIMGLVYPASYI